MSDETQQNEVQQAKSELAQAVEQYFLTNDKADLKVALLMLAEKIEKLEQFQSEFK